MKFDELKEKNDELKVEARESAHEVMNMEGTIADLKEENQKLLSQIEKITSEGKSYIKFIIVIIQIIKVLT